MITRQAKMRLGLISPFIGDGLLGLAVAVAAAAAASGATSHQPQRAFLVALAVGTALSLCFRRLYPVTVLAITVGTTDFFVWVYRGYWPFAALIAFYSVAAHSTRRRAIVAGAAGLLAVAVPIVHSIHNWQPDTWSRLTPVAGRLAPLVAAWLFGAYLYTRREYLRAVEDRAMQLEREQEANARRAAAEEQARIAREVHDVVAHNLSVIIVQATAAEAVFASSPADAQRAVGAIGSTARQALNELRRVLGVLRTGEERSPDLVPQPTLAQLETLFQQVRAAGLAVDLQITGEPRQLPPALELSAYRIVQEALTNTLRHADATHATATLRFDPDAVEVEIVDDGTPPAAGDGVPGLGLIGMRERAAAIGGDVQAGPASPGGFRVAARLPFDPAGR